MICPCCKKPFYFLKQKSWDQGAVCLKCAYIGAPEKPSYENYHEEFYGRKNYRRTPATDPQMKWIFSKLMIQPRDVVVDLGCGVGDYAAQIQSQTAQVAGYDQSVTEAKRKYPQLNFFEVHFEKPFPLPDASVDKVVSINVIEHLADWDFFLTECRRILRPGGVIAFSTANREFLLHSIHYDATHLHEWTLKEFETLTRPYFATLSLRKDCAMFNYYPLNLLLRFFLKPDITWIGRKTF